MATLTINDKTYDIGKLTQDAKAQVTNLRFVDAEIAHHNATLAVLQTARNTYIKALLPQLEGNPEQKTPIQ